MRITRRRRACLSSVAMAMAAGLAIIASPATAALATPNDLVPYGQLDCTSGIIEPGTYISILVIGNCSLTDFGTVYVNGDFRVAHDATFSSETGGTLIVNGNFYSGTNSFTDMGQQGSDDLIMGNVYSDNPYEMLWKYTTVGGWYHVVGENGFSDNTDCSQAGPGGAPATVSFEDGSVASWFTYNGNMSCNMKLLYSKIGGNVGYYGNTVSSNRGSLVVGGNVIRGALGCGGNSQTPVLGGAHKNVVSGKKNGQCKNL
jgi:hypothetical protein